MEKILKETIESLEDYLPRIIKGSKEISYNLTGGNEASAISAMPEYVEGIQWIYEALAGIQNSGFLREINLLALQTHFKEVVESLEIGDHVLLADILEYEITPIMETWLTEVLKVK